MDEAKLTARIALAPWAPLAVAALVAPVALAGHAWLAVASVVLIVLAAAWIAWLQRLVRTTTRRIADLGIPRDDAAPSALEAGVAGIERQIRSLRHRLIESHPVSGLPLREALIDRIAGDRHGVLGVIVFRDFDRLSAFDPVLADRIFAVCVVRLRAMLPADRFIAQIDRGHVGMWFGPASNEGDALAELDAVTYALGEVIVERDSQVIPQVAYRLAAFDPDEGLSEAAFVARTRALLSLPAGGETAGPARPAADQAEWARDLFALEQDLRQAIDRRELRLTYQPLIDASQCCVSGAEALIRWDHPTRGLIPPSHFVPLLEAMGLSQEIGMWTLNTALREARRWAVAGQGRLRVAVNVSSLQLEHDDLPQLIQRTLHGHGVGASQLEIELTESVAVSGAERCRAIFQSLRAMGIKLAVDDFGTGYSGFSSLRQLAFDKIKIDREFVTDVDIRADSQAICQSIIALGRGLGIRVLAEGVERHDEYLWLRRHGCHHFQGYLFGQPMAGVDFLTFAQDPRTLARLLDPHHDSHSVNRRDIA